MRYPLFPPSIEKNFGPLIADACDGFKILDGSGVYIYWLGYLDISFDDYPLTKMRRDGGCLVF